MATTARELWNAATSDDRNRKMRIPNLFEQSYYTNKPNHIAVITDKVAQSELSRVAPGESDVVFYNLKDKMVGNGFAEIKVLVVHVHRKSNDFSPVLLVVKDKCDNLFSCVVPRNCDGSLDALKAGCVVSFAKDRYRVVERYVLSKDPIRPVVYVFKFKVEHQPLDAIKGGDLVFVVGEEVINEVFAYGEALVGRQFRVETGKAAIDDYLVAKAHKEIAPGNVVSGEIMNDNKTLLYGVYKTNFRLPCTNPSIRRRCSCTCLTGFGINSCIAKDLPPSLVENDGCGSHVIKVNREAVDTYYGWYKDNVPGLGKWVFAHDKYGAVPGCLKDAVEERVKSYLNDNQQAVKTESDDESENDTASVAPGKVKSDKRE